MAKYVIDDFTLKNLANAIRGVNGETKNYTPEEMIEKVTNILESATYILVDESGKEVPAVYIDSEAVLTATANDIRIGTTAFTDEGMIEGEKEIPAYHVSEGFKLIPNNSEFILPIPNYDFKKLQAIICPFGTSLTTSVAAEKVAINGYIYPVQSTTAESAVVLNHDKEWITFGITNTSGKPYVLRYFSYKEIY
jgi:hypothetical protein